MVVKQNENLACESKCVPGKCYPTGKCRPRGRPRSNRPCPSLAGSQWEDTAPWLDFRAHTSGQRPTHQLCSQAFAFQALLIMETVYTPTS